MHKPKTSTNLNRLYLDLYDDTDKVLNNPEIKRQRLTADGYRHAATVNSSNVHPLIRALCDKTDEDTNSYSNEVRADVRLVLIPDSSYSHDAIREIWIRD